MSKETKSDVVKWYARTLLDIIIENRLSKGEIMETLRTHKREGIEFNDE